MYLQIFIRKHYFKFREITRMSQQQNNMIFFLENANGVPFYRRQMFEYKKATTRCERSMNSTPSPDTSEEHLEVTFLGKSWSIHAVKIVAVRSGDVAARWPFVFLINHSEPSDGHRDTAHVVRTVGCFSPESPFVVYPPSH
jgi:hypothetical protein